jgi:hypothetical protein
VYPDVWDVCCSGATHAQAQEAFGFLQTTLGVFDYYDSPDVKERHEEVFGKVKLLLRTFEDAYEAETGNTITNQIQYAWTDYMRAHFSRVQSFARFWVLDRLAAVRVVWSEVKALQAGPYGDEEEWKYATTIVEYCDLYEAQIRAGTKIYFDTSIFY